MGRKKTFVVLLLTAISLPYGYGLAFKDPLWFAGGVGGAFIASLVIVELADRLLQRIKQRIKS